MSKSNFISLTRIENNDEIIADLDTYELYQIFETNPNFKKYIDQDRKLIFTNCQFKKGISINYNSNDLRFKSFKIIFNNCYINYNPEFNIIKITSDKEIDEITLEFNNCIFNDLELINISIKYLFIFNCIFYNSRLLVNQSNIYVIHIMNSFGGYYINDCKETKIEIHYTDSNITLKRNDINSIIKDILKENNLNKIFEYKTNFNLTNLKSIYINYNKTSKSGYKREDKAIFNQAPIKESKYYLSQNDLKLLNISFSIVFSNNSIFNVVIKNGFIENLYLKGLSDSKLNIDNSIINNVYIHEFNSNETIFSGIKTNKPKGKFEIRISDLSNFLFNNVDLSSYAIVSIYRSNIEKTNFLSTEFPTLIEALENIHYPDRKLNNYPELQYENYRQLKNSLASKGNHLKAIEMHNKMYEAIEKSQRLSNQDKFILFLNRLSNKHGTSILRPFVLFILITTILHILYCIALPSAPYRWGYDDTQNDAIKSTIKFIWNNLNTLFVLADPTHRISSLITLNGEKPLSAGNYIFSYLSRILMAWVFYQFVSAFRKFGNKSSN